MDTYAFLLGTNQRLSRRELDAVLARETVEAEVRQPLSDLVTVKTEQNIAPLMGVLGGSVKLYMLLNTVESYDAAREKIASLLLEAENKSFILNSLDDTPLKTIAQDIKNTLKESGFNVSFRLLKDPRESAGVITDYQEFLILKEEGKLHLYEAIAVQNIDRWNQKDYERPRSDPKSGMLPPKIARLMLNLSVPYPPEEQPVIYDPFCGSGTVLMEALELNWYPIGSDLSEEAIDDSTQNLFWYQENFNQEAEFKVFEQNAVQLSPEKLNQKVDAIVFEGYLGPPKIKPQEVENQIKGRKKLYKGVFKRLLPLVKPGGYIVCALPEYAHTKYVKNLDSLVDDCEKFGYTQVDAPITYARETALVRRRIYTLQKKLE